MSRTKDLFDPKKSSHFIGQPYLIAEAGVNHECDMEIAKRLIREAKEGGADAIKFQTYRAGTIASKDSPSYWDTTKEATSSQFELFKKYDKFWKSEYEILKKYCDQYQIEFMSTPFDVESADFLNDLMSVYKISSSDITNKPFIQHLVKYGKPIILSTGASHLHEIQEAVEWIDDKVPLALLHCILNYPTDDENAHLAMISDLKRKYPEYPIGYSDHTLPKDMKVLELATALGAVIIEKHFTHDKTLPGNDHYHAMDKSDMLDFTAILKRNQLLFGESKKAPLSFEEPARQNARRSLVATQKIKKGQVITEQMLTFKRPAHGISPRFIDQVIGAIAADEICDDEVLQWKKLN